MTATDFYRGLLLLYPATRQYSYEEARLKNLLRDLMTAS